MKKYILPLTILVSLVSCQSEVEKLRDKEKELWTVNDSLKIEVHKYDSICVMMAETALENGDIHFTENPIYVNFDRHRQLNYDLQEQVLGDIKKVQDKIKSIELGIE